ncbi:hypothetical protein [Streptomyces sp. NPDC002067]
MHEPTPGAPVEPNAADGTGASAEPEAATGTGTPDGPGVPDGPGAPAEPAAADGTGTADDPAAPRPLGIAPDPTGEPAVDGPLRRLADADHLAVGAHLAVYEDVHRGLRDALAALDQNPGPPAPAAHGTTKNDNRS